MKKLKAFTLIELLVGMMVSSIVIGFGYEAYLMIYKQFLSFKSIKIEIIHITQFQTVFSNDMYNSEKVSLNDHKLTMTKEDKILQYEFEDKFILRRNKELCDTFNIAVSSLESEFVNGVSGSQNLVSSILFKAPILNEEEEFVFSKTYSAKTLMEVENLHKEEK